ncbi:hypothetical protein [uncultured Halomonas sp.]|uniref:hypothetical protein n=1 Tax=uncultured Halomonas sp. TaxID=173971 RepID=UPI0026159053|nr:hypothetical protein [uncultured Halomonas sp.]
MAITTKHTAWSPTAIGAMEFLRNAGWQWPAIAAHVSAIDGVERTRDACRYKARLPTILISNVDAAGLGGYLGERIVDRMTEVGGMTLTLDWESYRKEAGHA